MCKNFKNKVCDLLHGRIPPRFLAVFFGAFFCGLLAHAMAFFNKYSLYEDISQVFGVGSTYASGRWMLDILHKAEIFLLGGSFSLPLLNGIVSVLYIALSACLIVDLLQIKKPLFAFVVGSAMVTTPVLAGLFGYMFTAPHYMFGLLLAVAGCYLLCKYRKWYIFFPACLLIAASVGIYQANIPVALSVMLLFYVNSIVVNGPVKWRKYFVDICYFAAACLCFVLIYFLINTLYLKAMNATLLNYQDINSAGKLPITTYMRRVFYAFKMMFLPDQTSSAFVYPFGMIWLYRAMLLLVGVLMICLLYVQRKQGFSRQLQIIIPLAVLPVAINFIYVMCDAPNVHTLMVYSHTISFVFAIWLVSILWPYKQRLLRTLCAATCCGCLLFSMLYIRVDNICYLKAEFVQQQCISYFTAMRARIQSTPGYRDDMPVAYVNDKNKDDATVRNMRFPEDLSIVPYFDAEDILNGFAVRSFIENWTGFAPTPRYGIHGGHPEVEQMPCYPDEGCTKVIDGVLVIKFA